MNQPLVPNGQGHSDPGMQRPNNEDAWSGPPPNLTPQQAAAKGYLYLVADGVGGHRGGQFASRMAVQIIQQAYYADPNPDIGASLRAAIQEANRRIYHQGISSPDQFGMSTTITAAVVHGDQLVVANVGDSRTYLVQSGQARQLTMDHTWVEERRQARILTDAEAANHPQRNIITRSLGGDLDVEVDVRGPYQLALGDRVLLCTDGLSDLVSAQEMAAVVAQNRSPDATVHQLVELAKRRGAPDNVTAVMVEMGRQGRRPGFAGRAPGNLLALAATVGATLLVAALAWGLPRSGLITTHQPTSTPTPTASPTATITATPAPTATPLPAPELTGPDDGAAYYTWQAVTLAWTYSPTLEADQHFVVAIENQNGTQVLTTTVGAGGEMAYPFKPADVGLGVGTYRWTVWVEQEVEGVWEEIAPPGAGRSFRVLPPPTLTPVPPTDTPIPPTDTPTRSDGNNSGNTTKVHEKDTPTP